MFRHILVLETPTDALAELRAALSAVVDPSVRLEVVRDASDVERRLQQPPPIDVCVVPYPEGDGRTPAARLMRAIRVLCVPFLSVASGL